MTKAETARGLFLEGYNCCQAVVLAFAPECGLDGETAALLSSGMGGGIGRTRSVCGACTGMCLAAGLARGYASPKAQVEKTKTYAMIQQLLQRFEAANGSTICKELLGLARAEGTPQAEKRTEAYYKKRPCPDLVAQAAGFLEEYLAAHPAGGVTE